MKSAAQLVAESRSAAGLSCRALAEAAGVAPSTVTRIESGAIDPTVTMLQRLLAAAGRQLRAEANELPDAPSIARLAQTAHDDGKPRWNALRAFLDWQRHHPDVTASAIADPPARTHPAFDALLAGIAEKLADDARLERPRWCARVPPLDNPWEPPGTPRMIARAHADAPPQLKHRNVFLAETDLWRRYG